MNRKLLSTIALILAFPGLASASAFDGEIYTYGAFDQVTQAFQAASFILSDPGYRGLFAGIAVLSIVLSGAANYIVAARGGKGTGLAWLVPIFIGTAIGLPLFLKTDSQVAIYDAVEGKSTIIQNLPMGIVAPMSLLNRIERGIVEIIDTDVAVAGAGGGYITGAGGAGFSAISKASGPSDQGLVATISAYAQQCVVFELVRPGSNISMDELSTTPDLMATLAKAANPAILAMDYTQDAGGIGTTCDVVYSSIKTRYQDLTQAQKDMAQECAGAGITDPTACTNAIGSVAKAAGSTMSGPQLSQWLNVSNALYRAMATASPDTSATFFAHRAQAQGGISTGIAAGLAIPQAQGILYALAIAMIPLLLIFMPTPFFTKCLTMVCGVFVVVSVWRVIDAAIYCAMSSYAVNAFASVTAGAQGLMAAVNFPGAVQDTLAMFGYARAGGLTLSIAIARIFVRESGMLIDSFGHQLQAGIPAGAQAAKAQMDPIEHGQLMRNSVQSQVGLNNAHRYDFNDLVASATYAEQRSIVAGLDSIHTLGHGNVTGAAGSAGHADAVQLEGSAARAHNTDALISRMQAGSMPNVPAGESREESQRRLNAGVQVQTDTGSLTGAVDGAGNLVASNEQQGHTQHIASADPSAPTQIHAATSLGAVQVRAFDHLATAETEMLGEATRASKTASDAWNSGRTVNSAKGEDLVTTINNSTSFSESERKSFTTQLRASATVSESDVKEFARTAQVDESAARDYLTSTQAALNAKAGAEVRGEVGTPGWIKAVAGAEAKTSLQTGIEGSLGRTGSAADQDSIRRMHNAMDAKRWSRMATTAAERSVAIAGVRDRASTRQDTATVAASDAVRNSDAEQASQFASMTTAYTTEQDTRTSIQASRNAGYSSDISGGASFLNFLERRHGKAGAAALLDGVNNRGDNESLTVVNQDARDFGGEFAADVKARVAAIQEQRKAGATGTAADVEAIKGEVPTDLDAVAAANAGKVAAGRKAKRVEEGHKPATVSPELTSGDERKVRVFQGEHGVTADPAIAQERARLEAKYTEERAKAGAAQAPLNVIGKDNVASLQEGAKKLGEKLRPSKK